MKTVFIGLTLLALSAIAVAVSACRSGNEADAPAVNPTNPPTQPTTIRLDGPVDTTLMAVTTRLITALHAGNATAAEQLFAEDARFDSVGRIYQGRRQIMDRFLIPEVIRLNGRYEAVSARPEAGQPTVVVVEYNFTTGGGGRERFTYRYTIRNGLIQDVIGRYV
ncbi:nuclear transport factor 2 family protein [Spirosoma arcticum]